MTQEQDALAAELRGLMDKVEAFDGWRVKRTMSRVRARDIDA